MRHLQFIILLIFMFQAQAQNDFLNPNRYRFKYKSTVFKGTRQTITAQLRALKNNSLFVDIPEEEQIVLSKLFKNVRSQPIPKLYRKHAIVFLDALYSYEEFLIIYNNAVYEVIRHLKQDMRRLDLKFERQYIHAKTLLDRTNQEENNNLDKINTLTVAYRDSQLKLMSHRWMKKKIEKYRGMNAVTNPDQLIKEFKKSEAMNVFKMVKEQKTQKINSYLENQIIDFFYKKSIPEIDLSTFEFNHKRKK